MHLEFDIQILARNNYYKSKKKEKEAEKGND